MNFKKGVGIDYCNKSKETRYKKNKIMHLLAVANLST